MSYREMRHKSERAGGGKKKSITNLGGRKRDEDRYWKCTEVKNKQRSD